MAIDKDTEEGRYVISIVARVLGVHAQTLRYYERVGLIQPARGRGSIRLYSIRDIEKLRQVQRLMDDLGVNLAGAEVILRMKEHLQELEQEMEELRREVLRLTSSTDS
ncbi:MAG: MerR family transcriptional regulator [Dehalococcoidia bacterium]|nr:MerR family transcriptional regulator [Dehalococcoidia bacterium]